MRASFLLGLVLAGSVASQAIAGDAECLLAHLPAGERRAVISAYRAGGRDSLDQVHIGDAEIIQSYRTCGGVSNPPNAIGPALVGAALEAAAADYLWTVGGVPAGHLSAAWLTLSDPERQVIRQVYVSGQGGPGEIAATAFAALNKAVRLAGWRAKPGVPRRSDPMFQHYLDYFLGRAQKEAFERQF